MAKIDPNEQIGMVIRAEYDRNPGNDNGSRQRFRRVMELLWAELEIQATEPTSQSEMTTEDTWLANHLGARLVTLGSDLQRIRATQKGSFKKRGRM